MNGDLMKKELINKYKSIKDYVYSFAYLLTYKEEILRKSDLYNKHYKTLINCDDEQIKLYMEQYSPKDLYNFIDCNALCLYLAYNDLQKKKV